MAQEFDNSVEQKEQFASAATNLSLNDVAAILIQMDPIDLDELAVVRDALVKLAALENAPGGAQKLVEASQKVSEIIQGESADPVAALASVGHLIEEAENAAEGGRLEIVEDTPAMESSAEEATSADCLPADADPYFIGEFITESRENIENAEAALLSLETNPDDTEAVNTVFRAFHTVKGISMWLGLTRLAELAHHAESLLSRVRDREISCTGGYADLALRSIDMLKDLIQSVENALGGQPLSKPEGYDELMRTLEAPEAAGVSSNPTEISYTPPRIGDILVAEGKATREDVEATAESKGDEPIGIALVKSESASLTDVAAALRTQQRMTGGETVVESSVRVRTDRLDRLIDMVGELVIAHSMVSQDEVVLHGGHYDLLKKVGHTGKIVRELQDLSLLMRMVPLKASFQKMTRLVRDVAQKSGKLVNFVTEGEDTEIDRTMVDVISDPLVHMIRNACDHGIEPPDVREQAGKSRSGTVRLAAYHSGGNVVIEMRDDGRGLNREKIIEKAISRGLIESDKDMSDSQVFNLIFEPGFSTAETITDISGRGVGMDVVKRSIEAIKGRIEITSVPGQGSTFTIRLPLTLAITDGMLVGVGEECYIIPTVNIHLSFRPEPEALSTVVGCGELVRLREELMPVFRLHHLFNIKGAETDPTKGLLVVADDGRRRCALLVDRLLGKQQVVAKSLGAGIKIQGITGGAILGDGRVGLILDPTEIVTLAKNTPMAGKEARGEATLELVM